MARSKKSSSQASWALLAEGVAGARVEAHRIRAALNRIKESVDNSPAREDIYRRSGDFLTYLPTFLSKLERKLDATNYALITMGSAFYRQRLTHEDRERVDMASKYNPTPTAPTKRAAFSDSEMSKILGGLSAFILLVFGKSIREGDGDKKSPFRGAMDALLSLRGFGSLKEESRSMRGSHGVAIDYKFSLDLSKLSKKLSEVTGAKADDIFTDLSTLSRRGLHVFAALLEDNLFSDKSFFDAHEKEYKRAVKPRRMRQYDYDISVDSGVHSGADIVFVVRTYKDFESPLLSKRADLNPALGYSTDGYCHARHRVLKNTPVGRIRDEFLSYLNRGNFKVEVPNRLLRAVYKTDLTEKGIGGGGAYFRKIVLGAHAQFRMDLRGVTVPHIRSALKNFYKEMEGLPKRKRRELERKFAMGEKIVYPDYDDTRLEVVFIPQDKGRKVFIKTVYWILDADPTPKSCRGDEASKLYLHNYPLSPKIFRDPSEIDPDEYFFSRDPKPNPKHRYKGDPEDWPTDEEDYKYFNRVRRLRQL